LRLSSSRTLPLISPYLNALPKICPFAARASPFP
jgi:hypothetical protein